MIRFVDIRGQGVEFRFAFWNTVISRFECFKGEQAWDTWEMFMEVYDGSDVPSRYRNLLPGWAFQEPTEEDEESYFQAFIKGR